MMDQEPPRGKHSPALIYSHDAATAASQWLARILMDHRQGHGLRAASMDSHGAAMRLQAAAAGWRVDGMRPDQLVRVSHLHTKEDIERHFGISLD